MYFVCTITKADDGDRLLLSMADEIADCSLLRAHIDQTILRPVDVCILSN